MDPLGDFQWKAKLQNLSPFRRAEYIVEDSRSIVQFFIACSCLSILNINYVNLCCLSSRRRLHHKFLLYEIQSEGEKEKKAREWTYRDAKRELFHVKTWKLLPTLKSTCSAQFDTAGVFRKFSFLQFSAAPAAPHHQKIQSIEWYESDKQTITGEKKFTQIYFHLNVGLDRKDENRR